ncbi:rasGAP-activating-like protein 1 isoform X3 [Acanthaster planci]|uniref:RasGAP-activating-like protein 1 isoform X3 n=1 Tax=Acanthaster planci TaxID=133434 RepID=A0A8B7ZG68_ACAPL|nr:rasGAP-activating-like protein 1 isoform X3 [Acanthaster planci]
MVKNTSLYVRIGEAKDLPGKDLISRSSDPYCLIKIDNEVVARTATVWKTLTPFWGEEYFFHLPGGFQNLSVYVFDEDTVSEDDIIGKVSVDKDVLQDTPRGLEKWLQLVKVDRDTEVQGEIHVEATLLEAGGGYKNLKVELLEARDLAVKDKTGSSDPFARLTFEEQKFDTRIIKKTRFPRWHESFTLALPESLEGTVVDITVWDWDRVGDDDFMGRASLTVSELPVGRTVRRWLRLDPRPEKEQNSEASKNLGSIRIRARYSEERILPSQYYQPLVDLLVESVLDTECRSTPLTMLEEVMTLDRLEIATTLDKIFLGQGMILPFLDALIRQELQQSSDINTLFRGNSLATKCFDQFMKLVGMPYLLETLQPIIDTIYEERKHVELDPCKVGSIRRRVSMKNRSEGYLLEHSATILTEYLASIVNCILKSVDRCPPILRMALKQLRQRVEDKFPDNDSDCKYLCLSGFLFLRFFAPAILSPKLFFLRDQHPDKYVGRTLTLLAKAVQTIGNLGIKSGKEHWMQPLSPLIQDSVCRIKDFLDTLLDIDETESAKHEFSKSVPNREAQKRSIFHRTTTIKEGPLKKRRAEDVSVITPFTFKKRYFWLSYDSLSYAKHAEDQVRNTILIEWVCIVECVDEAAFQLDHLIQIIYHDAQGGLKTLYLQAKDVNEQQQWLSAIRKTCVSNPNMLNTFHPGAFRGSKWTCCLQSSRTPYVGCSRAHNAATLGDWRDPLDPDVEAQIIYSQLRLGKDVLRKKYLEESDAGSAVSRREPEEDSGNGTEDDANSPPAVVTNSADGSVVRTHKPCHKTVSYHDSRMASAATLLDVINDLERAHLAFQRRAQEVKQDKDERA